MAVTILEYSRAAKAITPETIVYVNLRNLVDAKKMRPPPGVNTQSAPDKKFVFTTPALIYQSGASYAIICR